MLIFILNKKIITSLCLLKERSILNIRYLLILLKSIFFINIINNLNSFSLSRNIGYFSNEYNYNYNLYIISMIITLIIYIILNINSFIPQKLNINSYFTILNNMKFYYIHYKYKILKKVWNQLNILEYYLIILFVLIGAMLIIYSGDLISLFLSIELQSYGLYIISSIYKNSELSNYSGLMYFLLGSLSSSIILLSIACIYYYIGNTNLNYIYIIYNLNNEIYIEFNNNINFIKNISYQIYWYNILYNLHYFLILSSIGFLFKISAAPFHFWAPTVYDGVPTIVTMFIAIIPKISILIFLSNLIKYTCISFIKINLLNNLIFSAILSILIGSILGLSQLRLKKLYAYSTINHIGYILIALAINSLESIKSFIFYLIQYSFLNLNIFIILYSLGYLMFIIKNNNITDKFNSPIQYIYQLKGYFYLNPILAISLCISLLSFIGIPPLIGFYGKQLILSSTIEAKKYFLVLLIIITSVISAIYYLNLIKFKFFIKPKLNIIFFNLKLGFSLKDLYIYIHILQKIFFSIKLLKKLKYCNVLYTLSSNITIIIVIITILSLVYVCIHDRFIIFINILSIYFI